jgi:hypothetical protein
MSGIYNPGSGGGGAPTTAQYLTLALDGGLSAERVFTPSGALTGTDGGANGAYTLDRTPQRAYIRSSCDFFSGVGDFVTSTSGTGASGVIGSNPSAGVTTSNFGWLNLTTGSTNTGRAALSWPNNAGNTLSFGAGEIFIEGLVSIDTLSDGTETFTVRLGFGDDRDGDGTDGIFFRYTHSVNSGKFECVTRSNSVETAADSGQTVAARTNYRLGILVNAAGTSVGFYINGTLVATNTTNIPTGTSRGSNLMWQIKKSAGTTSREIDIDYIEFTLALTSSR